MKGLGDSRPRHLSDSLDPPHEPLFAGPDRNPYLLSPTEAFAREARFPGQNALPGDGLFPLNNQLPPPSSTFPRIHYNSHFEVPEESPFPSHAQATKINRLPANLLDQFEKQLPIHRDGFSTLQFPRGEAKARGESPGRIRHLVHSVQRLFFTKAPSLEGTAGKVGGNGGKKGILEDGKGRRAKSKERAKAGEPKRRSRSNISGWWSSDDNLDGEGGAFRSSGPASGLMTLGRQAERSQPRYFMHAYNTISGHMLKAAKNTTTELTAPPPPPAPPATCPSLGVGTDTNYVKRGSWSTLTLSHAHEVCQKTSATLDKSLLKSKSCHQGLAYHYLQVPGGGGEWTTSLLSPREADATAEGPIPCRRMRSGSYIKAMGDEDSDESGGSPKPSPKTAARRQSYLRATQQSLGEQSNPRRSLDRLDSVDMLLPSKCPSWEEEYNPVSDSLNDSSCISQIFGQASLIPQLFGHEQQVREADLSDQYEAACESACSEAESTAAEALDLPLPSYFRSRSHSYLRAIQAGCSQEEDSVSLQSLSPPPSTGSLSNSRTLPSETTRLCGASASPGEYPGVATINWYRLPGPLARQGACVSFQLEPVWWGRLEGRSPGCSGTRVLTWARAPSRGRAAWAWAGLSAPRACAPALPGARDGPRAERAARAPARPGSPERRARASDAGGGVGRGRRGALTQRPRPSGVQNRSLGPGRVREEGECPPLAAAAASPSVTSSVCPVHVVAAAASARTPGARPAPLRAAAAPRGDGRRPRPALPPPSSQSVRPSVLPPARASVLLSSHRPWGPSPRSARFVSPWLAVSLSLPSRCLPAPPSLPDLGCPSKRSSHPSESPSRSAPVLRNSLSERPLILWGGGFLSEHLPYSPHIPWGSSLPSVPHTPGVLPPLSPPFCRFLPLLVSPLYAGTSDPLGSLLWNPETPQVPDFRTPSLPFLGLCPSRCSLSGLRAPPAPWVGVPCFAFPASPCPHICLAGVTARCLLRCRPLFEASPLPGSLAPHPPHPTPRFLCPVSLSPLLSAPVSLPLPFSVFAGLWVSDPHPALMALCLELLKQCSSCLVAYKKTPPPVPPRTTSKPFISVTVQSSTESAQDTYLDSQDHKSEVTSQSGLSNSSDSLDSSTRPPSVTRGSVTPAPEAPEPPPKHAALKSEQGTLTSSESHPEAVPKRKLSSIGIQVDCIQPVPNEEPSPATKFQSIGVQVEDDWRSSAPSHSMSSRRDTDSDTQDANDSSCKSSEKSLPDCTPHPNSISIDAGPRQAPKIAQIKRNLSYGDNSDPALEASSLPPPDPWLETSSSSPAEPAQPGACRRDGYWFLKLLQAETERLEGWCCQMDKETKENNLSEEVLGKVLSAVGSAQLLMSQKFQQFRGLCEQNLNPDANPRPTAQDLAGFWDLLQLSIEDISMKFDELYHLKANSWQLVETPEKRKEEKKAPPPVPKKPAKSKPAVSRDKASDAGDRQRQEARKRLLAAKRAASVRQNSATESADSIEIYVPEAQTRL